VQKVAQKEYKSSTKGFDKYGPLNMDTAPNKACIYQCHFWKNRPVFKAKTGV